MEREQPEKSHGVQITKAVFDGFEFIRSSGATNMLDRPVVLELAREWGFEETADWIESVDTRTYGELIFKGPNVIGNEPAEQDEENYVNDGFYDKDLPYQFEENVSTQPVFEGHPRDKAEEDDADEDDQAEKLNQAMDDERAKMRDAITSLSKIATLTIADTYETEEMGVQFAPNRRDLILKERNRLNQSLGEVSRQWAELNESISEVQRGVGSLQYMIDPENN